MFHWTLSLTTTLRLHVQTLQADFVSYLHLLQSACKTTPAFLADCSGKLRMISYFLPLVSEGLRMNSFYLWYNLYLKMSYFTMNFESKTILTLSWIYHLWAHTSSLSSSIYNSKPLRVKSGQLQCYPGVVHRKLILDFARLCQSTYMLYHLELGGT